MGQLNLIPMIDILTVMVSFLLVYSTNVEVVQNSKGIEIPQSISERQPRNTVVVMLTKDDLFVQGERDRHDGRYPRHRRRHHRAAARGAQASDAGGPADQRAGSGRARNHRHGRQVAALRGAEESDGAPAPTRTTAASRWRCCRKTSRCLPARSVPRKAESKTDAAVRSTTANTRLPGRSIPRSSAGSGGSWAADCCWCCCSVWYFR